MTFRMKRRASRLFMMNEGRKSQIVLLDDRRLDIIILPKLYSGDLLDLVASHFKLKEKHYFGLAYIDQTHHFNWLQGEKRVLDHDLPKKTGLLVLHFAIRFYVDTIGLLRDPLTVELFYLNARQALFRGQIVGDSETVFELSAHVLQASNGDFINEEETREELKKLPVIPTSTLKEHPSIAYCEDRVIWHYQRLNGTSRGLAIVNYMTIIEKLPTYGIHYYDVKDKKDIPWWLGISPKGIAVYDKNDKTTPRKLFTWKNLENLYYRDKKFSIEVHGPKRDDSGSQVSVSRRTFGASNVDVHAWFAGTPQLTKCIWSMAVAQHQFYLDRKQSKSQLPAARSMSEIAAELCKSTSSLPGSLGSDLSRSPSSHSLPSLSNSRYDLTIEQSDSLKAERDMYQALRARREALEDALRKKTEEFKRLCLQEGELTGTLPKDTPLAPGEQVPVFRRRVGTSFALSVKEDSDHVSNDLSKLALEVELQGKITSAAHRLASDKTVSKFVRKQRRQSYNRALVKLKEMEKKLGDMRKQTGKSSDWTSPSDRPSGSHQDAVHASVSSKKSSQHRSHEESNQEDPCYRSALSPSHSSPQLSASFAPNGGFIGRRGHHLYDPAFSGRNSSDMDASNETPSTLQMSATLRLDGSHDSGFSSANNMYNVNSQRTSHYESTDQLRSPATSEPGVISSVQSHLGGEGSQQFRLPGKLSGTDEPFQRRTAAPGGVGLHYGSLDRKRSDYRPDIYRDVSPMRYNSRPYGGIVDLGSYKEEGEGLKGYQDVASPAGVVLEVPVHHERGHSVPSPSPSSRHAWGNGLSSGAQTLDQDRLKPGSSGHGTPSFSSEHCYSPRMYEGSGGRMYQDVDISHVHPKELRNYSDHALVGAHHTASQPVFLRTERSVSPVRNPSLNQPHAHLQHRSGLDRQGVSSPNPHYTNFHCPQTAMSPTTETQYQSPSFFPDGSRTLPIHHVDSSHTPPPSSPISQYASAGQESPTSGPSSPRGLSAHATSTLVTVTRLQPHTEVSKPYEMSDFYRYSEKLRRQRIIDQYQRQLIGSDNLSRSSSPQSVESEGHSSHSGSLSHHPVPSNHTSSSAASSPGHNPPQGMPSYHPPINYTSSGNSLKQVSRGPVQPYNRSASAPIHSTLPPNYQPHLSSPTTSSPIHHDRSLVYPDGQISSSSSSYTIKSQGPNVQYAMQSSTYKIQQVHTSAQHSMYQPPQPMACKPVRNPPSNLQDSQRR